MPKGGKNMEKRSDEWFISMQISIESNKQEVKANKQYSGEKMTKTAEEFKTMI